MSLTRGSILILGCFDTKAEEFTFLYNCVSTCNKNVITLNTGVRQTKVGFPITFSADEVATAGASSIDELRTNNDRGKAVAIMALGASNIIARLVLEKKILGAIGMGGGGGTFIVLSAMQKIPLGIPKLCLSTLAGKDLTRQIAGKDITMMPSIVDIAGLNSISTRLIRQAAAAIIAMADIVPDEQSLKKRIAISMFGNTTDCVNVCTALLTDQGFEVFVFHSNGLGGKQMESLVAGGYFDAVLDITTTELADELCGGVCSAGASRLEAASIAGIPQVVVPGCLDMVNFSQPDTVPKKYQGRLLYNWAPDVTLMRTNEDENRILGKQLVRKLRKSQAPVTIVIPTGGISEISKEGSVFYRPEIDNVLFDTIREEAGSELKIVTIDAHINDEQFAREIVAVLLESMKQ